MKVIEKSLYEIERGKPMPSKNHGLVQGNIYFQLRLHYENKYKIVPELSMIIDGKEKIPDLAIYEKLEFTPEDDEVKVTELPLCAIEILSPQQTLTDLIVKSHVFLDAGVKSYWLVAPTVKTIFVYNQKGENTSFGVKDVLIDEKLDIRLNLVDIFK